jgi:RHS repeat-associated protein
MRRTSTLGPTFFRRFACLLLGWGLLLTRMPGQAQTLPASEGLVADSTELQVLRQLYQATGGPQWAVRDNWLQGTSLAEAAAWAGVGVSEGDVTSLSLVANQLRGPLPVSLGQLTGLRHLDLRANFLTDSLPASLGQLTQLLTLDVSSNQLRGRLPAELGNLRQLQGFGADYNQLTGPLPASLGNWAQMGWLSLANNQLTGAIPTSWGRMHALGGLLLQNNRLSGSLPDSLANCTQLGYVWLSNNRFTGAFPASWGRLQHLGYLELSTNQLEGPLPEELTQLAGLGTLNLTGNRLTGPLPDHWERMVGLASLGLGNNLLDGELPASFGHLPALAYCTLANNPQLGGALPAPVGGGWRHLVYLDASSSALTGALPDSLGNCRSLVYLNLSDNHLNGRLPATLGQLTSLEQFHAPRNAFTGALPASLGRLPRLWFVNLSQNQLSGPLPGAWGQLRSLRQLYLAANQLQGPLPDSLGQLAELGYLDLSQNQLTGSLPAAWQGLRGLQRLNVQENQLSGELPEALPVVELYLDRNRFSGPVPASYATSPTLRTLSLEGNDLTQLPDFNASPNLSQLRLSISDNWLEFDAYERNQPTADAGRWTYWNYSKTQRQPPAQPTTVVNGAAAQLSGRIGGAYNHYQWQRWVGGQWVEMPGATTPSLSWAAVSTAESGTYRTRVTSDWVTGITLYSRPLVLDVTPYQALAQNRPDDTNQGLPIPLFVATDSASWHSAAAPADMNYVRVWTPRTALTDSTRVPRAPIDSVSLSTQYLDGLGRPVQTVLKQASPQRRDMVQPQAYDGLGREPLAYLPYPDMKNGDGGYRAQALKQQHNFYYPTTRPDPPTPDDPTLGVARTGRPYAETVFEASPLNRVTAQGAAGEAWQVTAGHEVERVERPNTDADSVLWFQPGYDPKSLDPGYQGFYQAGELWGTDVADAHGPNQPGAPGYRTIEWKDKLGQVVLKQVEANRTGTTSTGLHSRWLRTAYVYDDFGHLRFVLQPEGTRRLLAQLQPGPTAPAAGLHSWLPLDQTSGSGAPDAAGAGPGGTLPSGGTWLPTGGHDGGGALALGPDQQLHLPLSWPAAPSGQPTRFTVAFWLRPTRFFNYGPGLGQTWGAFGFHSDQQGEVFVGIDVPTRIELHTPQLLALNTWQHLVFTFEDGVGAFYKDGQLLLRQAGMSLPQGWTELNAGSEAAYDELRVYDRALRGDEVQALYGSRGAGYVPQALAPYLFHYRYDGRSRQIAKQVPGQDGETLVVYDQLDRPVLSQDAQQRTRREWSWTKYDALGRIVLSGLVTRADTLGQVSLQALAAADTATSHQYEHRVGAGTANVGGYSYTQSFPRLGQDGFVGGRTLSVTRYDDYDFDNDGQADVVYNTSQDGQFPSGQAPVADALRTTGLVTRTQTRVLGVAESDPAQAAWLVTTTFYDERARPVQVQTTNARKDISTQQSYLDLLTTRLDFTGKVVQSVVTHQGPSHNPVQIAEFFTYDHTGRLLSTRQQLPGEARPALLDSVQYNEIGQAVRKTLATGRLQQEVDYAYNIRGWLTSLNDPYAPNPTKKVKDLFSLSLHYERGFTKGYEQYNGNLTGQTWRGRDGVQRAYGYVYDPLNRLLQGDFVARQTTTAATPNAGAWKAEEDNYRLSFVSYDDNGNILTLRRRGLLQNATHARSKQYGAVDNLTYAYQGNRLLAVDDVVSGNQLPQPTSYHGAPTSLAGDFQEQGVKLGEEYLYDANGNLTQDKNKGITGIVYNHLNLPRQIHFGQVGDSVVFRYTASGQKVAKLVYQTGKATPLRTDYLGPYQYEQDSLKFFPHAEGRVLRFVSGTSVAVSYQREFTVKDHLGNLRLAYRLGQVRTLTATLEQDANTHERESQQFDSLSVSPPVAVATGLARSGAYAAKLNAGGATPQPLGPLTQLGVQKGDTVTVTAYGTYPQAQQHGLLLSLAAFVTNLVHPASPPPTGLEAGKRKELPLLQVGLAAGLASLPQLSGGVPQGYLRLLVFNRDSALVSQQVQQLTQAANGGYEQLRLQVVLPQDGYVTAYVGSQSDVNVFFDDVSVEHRPGLQVQENQYEPWGLSLAGVNYNTPNIKGVNLYQYSGKEQDNELGLHWIDYAARMYNAQLGRWSNIDPLAEKFAYESPYNFVNNDPINTYDPDGCSGIAKKDDDKKEITVSSRIIFYGAAGSSEEASRIAQVIQDLFNAANGTASIDGIDYRVKFSITGEFNKNISYDDISKNKDPLNNYVHLQNERPTNMTGDGQVLDDGHSTFTGGGNSGNFWTGDMYRGSTTAAHEMLHGYQNMSIYNGKGLIFGHPADGDASTYPRRNPGMLYSRGSTTTYEYARPGTMGLMDPDKRVVNQHDIDFMGLGKLKYDANNQAAIGTVTPTKYSSAADGPPPAPANPYR